MAKSMWVRCPKCGYWCSAEKKNFFGRLFGSFKQGDKELGDDFAEFGDDIGMKGLGKTLGRGLNVMNIYKHGGEMLNGDNYNFHCACGHKFGTDDEEYDMTKEHELWLKAIQISKKFPVLKNKPEQEKDSFTREVQETLAMIENTHGMDDAKATLYDVLACCYFYFENSSTKALLEINKSLDLFDDEKSHVLKGLFMGPVVTPVENYAKMNELLRIKECDSSINYVEKATVFRELDQAEKNYGGNFIAIPESQRKFLVVTSDYTYLPDSFKVIKYNDTNLSGVVFENGFPSNNTIYVCHPYKPTVYYPSESYQTDLFRNQLNELRELLQSLGAKSIRTANTLSMEKSDDHSRSLNGNAGGEYKGVAANLSGEHKSSNCAMESMVQRMLIDDEFSFNPDIFPSVPEEGLVWYGHMEEWQRLVRMRLRGQNRYSISISSKQTHIISENEANKVNADFKALIAKGNLEISQTTELKVSEENSHDWNLVVEFYPLSEYNKGQLAKEQESQSTLPRENIVNNISDVEQKKKNYTLLILMIIIVLLLIVIGLMLI